MRTVSPWLWLEWLLPARGGCRPRTRRVWKNATAGSLTPLRSAATWSVLTARPHHVGSPYDKDNAEWILARFKEWGFDARIETFQVLFPTPKERLVEMLEPTQFRAKLQEPILALDPTSNQTSEQLPTYNAYSADGDVTAPIVYVNYGRREDYEDLDRLGISVKGAIVIARYGKAWRGIKPKVAGEQGAIGCIIYSDPEDDGYYTGDDYPTGGYRPKEGVQRGSVMDTDHPGDPLTPGIGATADAKRLTIRKPRPSRRFPSCRFPTPTRCRCSPRSGDRSRPRPGGRPPDHLSRRSGTGSGASQGCLQLGTKLPSMTSSRAAGVDATRPMGLARQSSRCVGERRRRSDLGTGSGTRGGARTRCHVQGGLATPKRTIIYSAWDGEEPGLLGSTEWVEAHAKSCAARPSVYVNTDGNDRGFLEPAGSHALERFINDVARGIEDPETTCAVGALAGASHRRRPA